MGNTGINVHREPWIKGKIVLQKAPFKLKDIWALQVRLQIEHRVGERALFRRDANLRHLRTGQSGPTGANPHALPQAPP